MARQRTIERLRGAIEHLTGTGYDLGSFAEHLVDLLQPVIAHDAACVLTIDPATLLVTGTYKFGLLTDSHDLDGLWAKIEYGSDDPTRLVVLAHAEVPARATSHLPGGTADSERMQSLVGPGGFGDELRLVARDSNGVWGAINLFRRDDQPAFSEDDVLILASLSDTIAAGIRSGLVARVEGPAEDTAVGPAVLIVDRGPNILQMSAGSTDIFDEFAVEPTRSPLESVVHFLAAAAHNYSTADSQPIPRGRLRSPSGRWLIAHAALLSSSAGATGDVVVTIDEARPPEIMPLIATAFGLTSREREVTQLVLSGSDTKAIAAELSMSRYTVQDHLKAIFDKADVRSRRELMARVFFDQYSSRVSDEESPTGWFASVEPFEPHPPTAAATTAASPPQPVLHDGLIPRTIGLVGREGAMAHARSLAASGVGVFLFGEAGVGKTRLLDELVDLLAEQGWFTERFVASVATRQVPFGPLLSLLPDGASDRTQQLAGIRQTLAERARGRRTVIAVDDAHLLDEASLSCLAELANNSEAVLVGTVRSTEPVIPELTALWVGEAVVRVDVDPLAQADCFALIQGLLEGRVSAHLADQVWTRTRGVPLFVRELLLDAAAQKLLTLVDGAWHLDGELRTGTRVQELVSARLATLPSSSRALIELLAVTELMAIDSLTPEERIELDRIEDHGLAHSERIAGRWMVRVDHPLIADAVVAAMSTRRRLELLSEAAGRVVAARSLAPGDALRAALWLEECHEPIPTAVALAAGREALSALDLDRARELGQLVVDDLPRDGHLLVGEVLRLQGRAAEAEASLAVAAELVDDDATIVQVAMWRSTLWAHHAEDPEGALKVLTTAADRVKAPELALELRSEAAFLAGILGRLDVAVDTNRQILGSGGLAPPTKWTAMMNLLFAQVMMADLAGVEVPITGMAAMVDQIAPTRPEEVDLYWALAAAAMTLGGDLARCEAEFVPQLERRIAAGQMHGITASILVHPLLYRGSPHAADIAAIACTATAQTDPFRAQPIALASQVVTHAQAGDLKRAQLALADLDPAPSGDLRLDGFIGRAEAAVRALQGDLDGAAEVTAAIGRHCIDGTYVQPGMLAMYDTVRYGRADLVIDDLKNRPATTTSALIDTMADHAKGQIDGDIAVLHAAAESFAAMGAHALVPEVLDDIARVASDEITTARAATTAALWRRATAAPHALARTVASPLSDRELEVVERTLRGQTRRTIAEQMFTAVHSVDTCLAEATSKLRVANTAELASALAPPPPSASQ